MIVRDLIRELLRTCELDQEIYCAPDLGDDTNVRVPCVSVLSVTTHNKTKIAIIETLPEQEEGLWDPVK